MTEELGVESEAVAISRVDAEQLGEIHAQCGDIVFMMAASRTPASRPDLGDFARVEPRNLSASSISFYSDTAPPGDRIVLLMGNPAEGPIYVSADVTSCNEGFWERRRRYLIGCELTGRL